MNSPRPTFPRIYLWIYLIFSVGWLVANALVILRFRMLDSDSLMYGLPLAFAHNPFDLRMPWLVEFESYDRIWAYSWMGGMWLRAALYSIIPFSRTLDIVVILAAFWGAATVIGRLIWKSTGNLLLTACGVLVILSDRLMLNNLQLHRFESLAMLALVTLFAFVLSASKDSSRPWLITGLLTAFLVPTLHPICLAVGGIVVGFMLWRGLVIRNAPLWIALSTAAFALAGIMAFFLWFYLQPGAWEQFVKNMKIQDGLRLGYDTAWVGLGQYHYQSGRIFCVLAALSACLMMGGFCSNLKTPFCPSALRWLPAFFFIGVIAFFSLTRSSNFTWLSFQYPAGVLLIACVLQAMKERGDVVTYRTGLVVYAGLAVFFATILPHRLIGFAKAGFPDFQQDVRKILALLPGGRKVYIPNGLWGAAINDNRNTYRLSTFAKVSPREMRLRYEKKAYADLKPGDILILDRFAGRNLDPNTTLMHVYPTFHFQKPDPHYWKFLRKHKSVFPGLNNSDFGYDFDVYEFLGGDWVSTLQAGIIRFHRSPELRCPQFS